MRNQILLLAAATALAGCVSTDPTLSARGVEPLNVPVVTRADFVFDAAAPDGRLSASERARLDGWFAGLGLGYGDSVYVDAGYAERAKADVAQVAGRYGLLLRDGAPVVQGETAPGTVRVVVSRTRASVPNCPNWGQPSERTLDNIQLSNLGCSVNSNLAAMIANPEDLVHGQEAGSVVDSRAATRAVDMYRKKAPTGQGALPGVSTK